MEAKFHHPYAPLQRFPNRLSATQVLCAASEMMDVQHKARQRDAMKALKISDCDPPLSRAIDLTGKVALVGQLVESDRQPTPTGEDYGVVLQGSYIEDLLNGSFAPETPSWLEWLETGLGLTAFLALYFSDEMVEAGYAAKIVGVLVPAGLCGVVLLVFGGLLWHGQFAPGLLVTVAGLLFFVVSHSLSWLRCGWTEGLTVEAGRCEQEQG